MGFDLRIFGDEALQAEYVEWLVEERSVETARRFGRMWDYYANPTAEIAGGGADERKVTETGRCYVQAQEWGLPARITGLGRCAASGVFCGRAVRNIQRKEVVIENDIAWRINAAVDFLFGKPISFVSKSPDSGRRAEIETIVKAVFSANGGMGFFQDMAVLGAVYGFVDCIIRPGEEMERGISQSSADHSHEAVLRAARAIGLELVDAPRALPILDENDYRRIRYYMQHFRQARNRVEGRVRTFLSRLAGTEGTDKRETTAVTEIMSERAWQRYEDGGLVAEKKLPWGFLPVVHVQNVALPFYYEGTSDVEPLMGLQDELNTRLSDRASRITMQSFKMYLGKGIEGFTERPVSPGTMWHTDNPDATIEEFGGDAAAPSEDLHIAETREAMDKISGVTPLAAGVLRSKLGNLTSAVALKLTLMGMLSKTQRKQFTYGEGLRRIAGMVLEMLDTAGIYRTSERERDIEIVFPNPLPENEMERLQEAQMKKELGVRTEEVLRELGY